jgi:hypothetical protein
MRVRRHSSWVKSQAFTPVTADHPPPRGCPNEDERKAAAVPGRPQWVSVGRQHHASEIYADRFPRRLLVIARAQVGLHMSAEPASDRSCPSKAWVGIYPASGAPPGSAMIRRTCHATSAISRTSPMARMVMATPGRVAVEGQQVVHGQHYGDGYQGARYRPPGVAVDGDGLMPGGGRGAGAAGRRARRSLPKTARNDRFVLARPGPPPRRG